jgi:hypothetical protein
MARLAWTCSRAKLTKHENELEYLKGELDELKSLKETTTTDQTWRDVTETWQATLALLKSVEVERGRAVLQCIASDEELLKALGMAEALYKAAGDVPIEVVVRLNDGAGAHIRTHAYKYDKLISQELVRIRRVKDIQWRALTLAGSALVAAMIGTANLLSRVGSTTTCCGPGTAAWLCFSQLARWRWCSGWCSAAAPATIAARSRRPRSGCARPGRAGCAGLGRRLRRGRSRKKTQRRPAGARDDHGVS